MSSRDDDLDNSLAAVNFKGVINALISNKTKAPLKETPNFNVTVELATGETTVARDLKLTVWPIEKVSTIQLVVPEKYPQRHNVDGSITISFGDLNILEFRKVIVTLKLLAASSKDKDYEDDVAGIRGVIVFRCSYNYRDSVSHQVLEGTPLTAAITRSERVKYDE